MSRYVIMMVQIKLWKDQLDKGYRAPMPVSVNHFIPEKSVTRFIHRNGLITQDYMVGYCHEHNSKKINDW
jgi:hypothetical protein